MVPAIVDLIMVSRDVPRAKHLSFSDFTYEIDELVFFDDTVFVFVKLVEPLVILSQVVLSFTIHVFENQVNKLLGFFSVQKPVAILVEIVPHLVNGFLHELRCLSLLQQKLNFVLLLSRWLAYSGFRLSRDGDFHTEGLQAGHLKQACSLLVKLFKPGIKADKVVLELDT